MWESNPPFPLLAGNTGFEGRAGHQNPMHSPKDEYFDNTQFFLLMQLFSSGFNPRYDQGVTVRCFASDAGQTRHLLCYCFFPLSRLSLNKRMSTISMPFANISEVGTFLKPSTNMSFDF